MRLLLTSGGVRNAAMRAALAGMLGQDFGRSRLVYVSTASTAQDGHHDWFVEDLTRTYGLGWAEFNVLELNGLPPSLVARRLRAADVVYVGGGNAYHLARSIADNGLTDVFRDVLDQAVYVGASAGSMVLTKNLTQRLTEMFGGDDELLQAAGRREVSPFEVVDCFIRPHADPQESAAACSSVTFPVYAIDDDTAIAVTSAGVEVVSEGTWAYYDGGGVVRSHEQPTASPTSRDRTPSSLRTH